jgi:hypothetical protein
MTSTFLRALAQGLVCVASLLGGTSAWAQSATPPNILVIFGDDIGIWNLSAYSRGGMGYRTPNIDSIGKEGAIFTDHYAQPSCTAGRAAFITGQLPIRTSLTTVGLVGAKQGLQATDATLAEVLKTKGYTSGQFGKNHLGDRNEFLPTVHGFDEFFGNLYHLNTEEEPEDEDYPTDPAFKQRNGPRGVMHCTARKDNNPETPADPRFGAWGAQDCKDVRLDAVQLGARLHLAGPAQQHRHAHAAFPGGHLLAAIGCRGAMRPGRVFGPVVGRVDDDGVLAVDPTKRACREWTPSNSTT